MWLSNTTSHVWPSGGALATIEAPTTPAPPGLLSTMMFQPVFSVSLAWMMRATGSVEPPGGNGTTNRNGPLGQSGLCARRMVGAPSDAAVLPNNRARRRSTDMNCSLTRYFMHAAYHGRFET